MIPTHYNIPTNVFCNICAHDLILSTFNNYIHFNIQTYTLITQNNQSDERKMLKSKLTLTL